MDVHVVGDDPVYEAVVAALQDVDVGTREATPGDLADARFAVVSDVAGAETFRLANEAAREGATPWVAVEVGGVGGRPLSDVDASVAGFAARTGCYECLRARVASTVGDETTDRPRADRSAVRLASAIAGYECVRVFAGDDPSILGSVVEVPHARRRFFPVPGCACGPADRDRSLATDDDEASSLEEAVERAELAIDDRVGLVTSIGEVESFPAPYYLATAADTTAYSDASAPSKAAGVDPDWNAALMKAVGESLERYCAGVYREADFVRASYDELDDALAPTRFVRSDDAPAFDPTAEYRWVEGEDLETGATVHLPAAAVHFPQPGERVVPQITTGLGLGSSTVDALRSGLTEVVERDATMLSWYSTGEPLEVAVDDDTYDALERRARSEGLSATALLVTQDVDVPVVSVALYRTDGDAWPAAAVGSAAGLDAVDAARSALAEALQNWMELRSIGPDDATEAGAWIGEHASDPDAVREFASVTRTIDAEAVGPDPAPEGVDALDALVDRVVDAGLSPYAARLTTRDVATIGFGAVRVLVPGAQPLFTDEPYFGERARSVPPELGFEPWFDREPHPYP